MNCKNCGEPIPDKGVFCIKCGTKASDQADSNVFNTSSSTDNVIKRSRAEKQNRPNKKTSSSNVPTKNLGSDDTGDTSFLKSAISVLLGVLLFVSTLALVLALVFRPSSIPKIIANSNIGKALEQYGITEKIANEMNTSKLYENTVEVEEITGFFNRKSVSEKIGGLSEEYVNAISSGYYDYYLTPKGLVSFLKEISPEISEEFNYKLTKTDYDTISNSFTENGRLKQFTIGRLLDQSQVSYSTPYILFSKYPLIIFAALSALLILDIFLHHRNKIRKAFLNAGIPIAAAGFVFVVVSIIIGPFSDVFSGSNLNGDMNIAKGASSNLLIAGLLSAAVGVLAIATFFIIQRSRKNSVVRDSDNKAVGMAGLIANPVVLILCGVLLFLSFRNVPEASAFQRGDDPIMSEASGNKTPEKNTKNQNSSNTSSSTTATTTTATTSVNSSNPSPATTTPSSSITSSVPTKTTTATSAPQTGIVEQVKVPLLIGMQFENASTQLNANDLVMRINFVESNVPYGEVISQSINPGQLVNKQTVIAIEASAGRSSAPPATVVNNDFIFQDSSTRYLTGNDLRGLTKDELVIARNEIFARHGRQFVDAALRSYFNSKTWYINLPKLPAGTEPYLSSLEKANVSLIQAYE